MKIFNWRPAITLLLINYLLIPAVSSPQSAPSGHIPYGAIKGKVIDALTKSPVGGASVMISRTSIGTATDEMGEFGLSNIAVGNQVLEFSSVAYNEMAMPDVVVKSNRVTYLEVELQPATLNISGLVVRADYFAGTADRSGSNISFSTEEIRRSPGCAGDFSRILSMLASTAKVTDLSNALIVRGGAPAENGFYLDNIEIPNINHFPLKGSTGGPIGLLNVDFIKKAVFSAGGFSAAYGDKLSSITDLQFRDGNRTEFEGRISADLLGFSLAAEGPLGRGNGSYLLSFRRSSVDMLARAFGYDVVPNYTDLQGKISFDLSRSNTLSFLGVAGKDYFNIDQNQAARLGMDYGIWDGNEYAAGINWRSLWGRRGYSNTSFSVQGLKTGNVFYFRNTGSEDIHNDSKEIIPQLRNVNVIQINASNYVQFGLETKWPYGKNNYFVKYRYNPLGGEVPEIHFNNEISSRKIGLFVSHTWKPAQALNLTFGYRYDYFGFNDHRHYSPRFSFEYRYSSKLSFNGAAGVYYQFLPLSLLAQYPRNKDLDDPRAVHYLAGLSYLLTENTRLTVEGYYKSYSKFPLDPVQPPMFVVDEVLYSNYPCDYPGLVSAGVAKSYGVELTVQKKLVSGIYGLISGSYSRCRYRGLDQIWRDRVMDNRVIFAMEGGYHVNNNWELSLRWIYAGGPPYTPIDEYLSVVHDVSILDRNRVNLERYPDYHSLNIRIDRRFNFHGSNLGLYISIWNLYNRHNIHSYYWSYDGKSIRTNYQLGFLPIAGINYEF